MDIGNPSHSKGNGAGLQAGGDTPVSTAFCIALSARDDAKPFGAARGGETVLNARGKALAACWRELAETRPGIEPDALVIGPRRLQGILLFPGRRADAKDLAEAVRLFKVLASLRLAQLAKTAARRNAAVTPSPAATKAVAALWKKGYSEQALEGAAALAEARKALKGLQAR
jgi:hypothetical protein